MFKELFSDRKLSRWYFLINILWIILFSMFGIESGEGSQPTADSNPVLDTIFIFSSPFVLSFVFYNLYNKVNKWIVFSITPFLGIAMEWLLFKPADVLSESTNLEATIFFAFIWTIILIPPYFLTKIADISKKHKIVILTLVSLAFIAQVINLTT